MKQSRSKTLRILNSLLLVGVILSAQFVVLTHKHDSLQHNADALCKVCISGEHLGHGLATITYARIAVEKASFFDNIIIQFYPSFNFTHSLARAPPIRF
ncbi:hypothetical protein [Kaarinaea lacus]